MNKIAFISLFAASFSFGQEVKFKNAQLENGLVYPTAVLNGQPEIQEKINRFLISHVQSYSAQDMCIGQFGFVQKGSYIQINQYVNCMEMESSINHYLLFDLKTGDAIPVSSMVDPTRLNDFNAFLSTRILDHLKQKSVEISLELEQTVNSARIDDFDVLFGDQGVTVMLSTFPNLGDGKLSISWNDLQRFLKVRLV